MTSRFAARRERLPRSRQATARGGCMPTWAWILIIVLLVLVLFGGVGYGRRGV
ncbi:MAG TPA: hypothetical protein VFN93_06515 [Gaiellaceae bacterium]|nr:hypothetical protein [Gaiellaceae bacterium]